MRKRLYILALVVLAFTLYLPNLGDEFLGDDYDLIASFHDQPAPYFARLLISNHAGRVWGGSDGEAGISFGYIRPVNIWSLALDYFVWGTWATGFHLTSTALFAGLVVLVFLMFDLLVPDRSSIAFLCASVAAMHPVFSEIVPFIAAREELLAAMLGIWAIYAFARHRIHGRPLWPFYVLYAGALLSKESGIATILFVAGFDLLSGRLVPRSREQLRGLFRDYFPAVALVFGYFCLRLAAFGHVKGGEPGTSDFSLAALGNFHLRFYTTLFDPTMFSLDRVPGVELLAGWIGLAAVAWVVRHRRRLEPDRIRALVFLGPVWYGCSTLILFIAYYSPRHNILPTLGLFLFGGVLLCGWIDLGSLKRGVACATVFPLLASLLLPPTIQTSLEFREAARTVRDVRLRIVRETGDLPDGSTVLLQGVPQWGVPPWYFGWGLLWALRQPFTASDTADRLTVISPENLAMNEIRTGLPQRFDRVIRIDPDLVSPYMLERRALRVARDE